MRLPTSYASYEELATTIGHELFHNFQHSRLTVAEMAGNRRWLMEATAEYAAYYVATDYGMSRLHRGARPYYHLEYFSNREAGHEYAMAAFIHFLVQEGADFADMWRAIVDNRPMLQKAFQDYVLATVGSTTTSIYREFWHHVLTNSNLPGADNLRDIGARMILFHTEDLGPTVTAPMSIRRDWSMDIIWFRPRDYDAEGKALITVEPETDIPEGVRVDVFKPGGFAFYMDEDGNRFTTYDKTPGGIEPHGSLFDEEVRLTGTPQYLEFEMEEANEEILIITAYGTQGGASFDIKISQMSLELDPPELHEVDPEEEYEFTATIHNVPRAISEITFRWKLENGETIVEQDYVNDDDQISDELEFSFEYTMGRTEIQNLDIEVVNTKTGEIIKSGTIVIEEDPEVIILGERHHLIPLRIDESEEDEEFEYEHTFEAVVKPEDERTYLFEWDFDDGNAYSETGETSTNTHTYSDITEEDVFNPKVSITPVIDGEIEGTAVSEDSIRLEFTTEPEGIEGSYTGYLVIEEADKFREFVIDLFTPFGVMTARIFGSDASREEVREIIADSIEETGINQPIGLSMNIQLRQDGDYLIQGYVQGDEGWVEYSSIGIYQDEVLYFDLVGEDGSAFKMDGILIDDDRIEGVFSADAWGFIKDAISGSWAVERDE